MELLITLGVPASFYLVLVFLILTRYQLNSFSLTHFRMGITINRFSEPVHLNIDEKLIGNTVETENGYFKFLSNNICLLRQRSIKNIIGIRRPYIPLPSELKFHNGVCICKARILYSYLLTLISFSSFFGVIGYISTIGSLHGIEGIKSGLGSAGFMFVFLSLLTLPFFATEKKLLEKAYSEMKEYVKQIQKNSTAS